MYTRIQKLSETNSFFLFGARATGKSTLLHQFASKFDRKQIMWIDLLDPELERHLTIHPNRLLEKINAAGSDLRWVIIDEVQKSPKLLDVAHKVIFEKRINFALSGSSARKLKRGKANLLAGRAFGFQLHPLSCFELKGDFNLIDALQWGTLPEIYRFGSDQDKRRYLNSYVQNYLKEEVLVEQLVRKIEPFRLFLEVAAQCNTEILNYAKIAREAGIHAKSVERYFEILRDTLLGFYLEPFAKSVRKRQTQKPKFYFFDIGVCRALANQLESYPVQKTYGYGKLFEQLVVLEAIRLNHYYERNYRLSYLRTKDNREIDLVLERGKETIFIEIKSTDDVLDHDLKTIKALGTGIATGCYVLCQEKEARQKDGIKIANWRQGLKQLFQ